MKRFYMGIPWKICQTSIAKDPNELIGAGTATFYHQEKRAHLTFLGLRPKEEIPTIGPDLRKKAIFRFQESYNRMVQWMGGTRTTTNTAIIPDQKMQALGWQPVPLSCREYLRLARIGFPGSLGGKLRYYEIRF